MRVRLPRAMWYACPAPWLASSSTLAPLRSSSAFSPWVVPCTKKEIPVRSATTDPSAANTPSARSPGVLGAFDATTAPVRSS